MKEFWKFSKRGGKHKVGVKGRKRRKLDPESLVRREAFANLARLRSCQRNKMAKWQTLLSSSDVCLPNVRRFYSSTPARSVPTTESVIPEIRWGRQMVSSTDTSDHSPHKAAPESNSVTSQLQTWRRGWGSKVYCKAHCNKALPSGANCGEWSRAEAASDYSLVCAYELALLLLLYYYYSTVRAPGMAL